MSFDPSRFGKWAHKAIQLDSRAVERARKVLALHDRGATPGEREAATARLVVIAAKAGISPDLLIKALR